MARTSIVIPDQCMGPGRKINEKVKVLSADWFSQTSPIFHILHVYVECVRFECTRFSFDRLDIFCLSRIKLFENASYQSLVEFIQ